LEASAKLERILEQLDSPAARRRFRDLTCNVKGSDANGCEEIAVLLGGVTRCKVMRGAEGRIDVEVHGVKSTLDTEEDVETRIVEVLCKTDKEFAKLAQNFPIDPGDGA